MKSHDVGMSIRSRSSDVGVWDNRRSFIVTDEFNPQDFLSCPLEGSAHADVGCDAWFFLTKSVARELPFQGFRNPGKDGNSSRSARQRAARGASEVPLLRV